MLMYFASLWVFKTSLIQGRSLISIVVKQTVECVWALACAAGVVETALDGAVAAVLLMNGTWAHGHFVGGGLCA